MSIARSYVVTDSNGLSVFRITGRARFARTFVIMGKDGTRLFSVREKLLALDPTYIVTRQNTQAALVRRTTTSGATVDRFTIDLGPEGLFKASGKLYLPKGISVKRGEYAVARIWRNQEVLRETLEVEISSDCEQALFLAVTMSIAETDSTRGQTPPDVMP